MDQVRKVEKMLSTTGREIMVEEESMLDAVTALSGSGPAYFYYIVKHMIEAGKQMGLDESMSALLVKQTMVGAYHLMANSNKNLNELIANVKSKGGTTEAALNKFDEKHVGESIIEALKAAENRAKELSK
jgi:pyrroline-5-carboxylate reductase